jgi:hypothetical protein
MPSRLPAARTARRNCSVSISQGNFSGQITFWSPPPLARLLFLHTRVDRDPIYFPGLAAVCGERLLDLAGFCFDVRDDEAHQDRASVEILLIVKLAPAVLEFASRRRAECAVSGLYRRRFSASM